jgi:hypothetical protein
MIRADAVIEVAKIGMADAAAGNCDSNFAVTRRRDEGLANHRLIDRCHHPTMRRDSLSHFVSLFYRGPLVCQLRSIGYFGKLVQEYQISKSDFRTCG